jgi:hypothetical protein
MGRSTAASMIIVAIATSTSSLARATDPLPEGDQGIAARYPHDAGIEDAPEVIFADDFESYDDISEVGSRWDVLFHAAHTQLTTEPEHRYAGRAALQFEVPQQDNELSNSAAKLVSPGRDVLFLRYYSKFESTFDAVGSSHNGSSISASYFVNGQATPGVPADGTNKFLANLENWRGPQSDVESPGALNIYIYHPEQRSDYGDHFFPTGIVLPFSSQPFDFGPRFVARPDIVPELDRWYCYELMVQANTPGERDGRIAFWFEGELAADFQNLRLRDVEDLKIDRFAIGFHIGTNPAHTRKWYDNVVAASAYIGPMYVPDASEDTTGDGSGDSGGTPPDDDGTDPGGDGTTASGSAEGGSSTATEPMATPRGDEPSGCACTATERSRVSLVLLLVLAFHRRRTRA